MQISQKQKPFSEHVSERFQKKMTLIADVFPKLWTPKSVVKQISKKYRFRGRFDKQHAKGDQTLLKSEPHNLYHIYCSM